MEELEFLYDSTNCKDCSVKYHHENCAHQIADLTEQLEDWKGQALGNRGLLENAYEMSVKDKQAITTLTQARDEAMAMAGVYFAFYCGEGNDAE
jgi:hypothetical protein